MQFNTDFNQLSGNSYSMNGRGRSGIIGNGSTDELEPVPISSRRDIINVVNVINQLPFSLTHKSEDYLLLLSNLPQQVSAIPKQQYAPSSAAGGQQFSQGFKNAFSMDDLEPQPIQMGVGDSTSLDHLSLESIGNTSTL
jgi:hypothetical protein